MADTRSGRRFFRPAVALAAVVLVCGLAVAIVVALTDRNNSGSGAHVFAAGAASVSITPPAWTPAADAAFVAACGGSTAAVEAKWPGRRLFAFEDPYVDKAHLGRFAPGDPYCDASHSGYYEGIWLAGGSGDDRAPLSVQPGNAPQAEAAVVSLGARRVAVVVVDSIGLFNVTIDRIRADAARLLASRSLPPVSAVFVSSTHDESAPDPLGLWGPDLTTTGVDPMYLDWLADQASQAIATADSHVAPATLRLAYVPIPSDVQSCWSSYPFIDDRTVPVMQAVDASTGRAIFTLVNANSHVETLAFSSDPADTTVMSADWAGLLRQDLEAALPGSVGIEMSGLVGSVETPSLYSPASTKVSGVPGPYHSSPNPDGCDTVYANPVSGGALTGSDALMRAFAASLAAAAQHALAGAAPTRVGTLVAQQESLCIQLENSLFAVGFQIGLFPERPGYADPTCTKPSPSNPKGLASPRYHLPSGSAWNSSAMWLKTDVGVLTVGSAQFVYSPGEVFPFTEIRGHIDAAQMPFPTGCYRPHAAPASQAGLGSADFSCGAPEPITPWISADMTEPFKFMAGLGEDMIGYLMPPGDFVGSPGEVAESPWSTYHTVVTDDHDRFGFGHPDDEESVGPHAALAVTTALAVLLANDGRGIPVLPGLYVDAAGRLSDSPFAGTSLTSVTQSAPAAGGAGAQGVGTTAAPFSGAVGIEVFEHGGVKTYMVGGRTHNAWATFDGTPGPGTPGTGLAYSVDTGGVLLGGNRPLLIDVWAGAAAAAAPRFAD